MKRHGCQQGAEVALDGTRVDGAEGAVRLRALTRDGEHHHIREQHRDAHEEEAEQTKGRPVLLGDRDRVVHLTILGEECRERGGAQRDCWEQQVSVLVLHGPANLPVSRWEVDGAMRNLGHTLASITNVPADPKLHWHGRVRRERSPCGDRRIRSPNRNSHGGVVQRTINCFGGH